MLGKRARQRSFYDVRGPPHHPGLRLPPALCSISPCSLRSLRETKLFFCPVLQPYLGNPATCR